MLKVLFIFGLAALSSAYKPWGSHRLGGDPSNDAPCSDQLAELNDSVTLAAFTEPLRPELVAQHALTVLTDAAYATALTLNGPRVRCSASITLAGP